MCIDYAHIVNIKNMMNIDFRNLKSVQVMNVKKVHFSSALQTSEI